MRSRSRKFAPKAGGAAKGAFITPVQTSATSTPYSTLRPLQSRIIMEAIGPAGAFTVSGQVAKALGALLSAGTAGVTALEVNSWAYRLGAYVHTLRHDCGLTIETVRELHDGGWHGRYVLRSPVSIGEAST